MRQASALRRLWGRSGGLAQARGPWQERAACVHGGGVVPFPRWHARPATPGGGMAQQRRLAQSSAIEEPLPNPLVPRATVRGNLGEIMSRLRPGEKTRIEVAMSRAPEPRDRFSLLVGAFIVLMLSDVIKEVIKEMMQRDGTVEEALKDPSVNLAISAFIHAKVVPNIEKGIFRKEAERVGVLSAALEMKNEEAVRQCSQKLHWSYSAGPMVGLFSFNGGPYQGLDVLPFSLWNSRKVATASAEFDYKRSDDVKKTVRLIAFFRNDFGFYRLLALAAYDADEVHSPMRVFHFRGGYAGYLHEKSRKRFYDAVRQTVGQKVKALAGGTAVEANVFREKESVSDRTERLIEEDPLARLEVKLGDATDALNIRRVAEKGEPLAQAPYRYIKDSAFAIKNPAILLKSARDQNWMGVLQKGQVLTCAIRFPRGSNLITNGKATSTFEWSEEKFAENSPNTFKEHVTEFNFFGDHSSAAEEPILSSQSDDRKKVAIIRKKKEPSQRRNEPIEDSTESESDSK